MFYNQAKNAQEIKRRKAQPCMVVCRDKPGALGLRKETRERHLEYLRKSGQVIAAGPLFAAEGALDPIGSLVLINVEDIEGAREFAAGDPYYEAGVFEDVFVSRYNIGDVSGKFVAVTTKPREEEDLMDEVEEIINADFDGKGKEVYAQEKTPWLER
jgi:uncharacterized protein YciI